MSGQPQNSLSTFLRAYKPRHDAIKKKKVDEWTRWTTFSIFYRVYKKFPPNIFWHMRKKFGGIFFFAFKCLENPSTLSTYPPQGGQLALLRQLSAKKTVDELFQFIHLVHLFWWMTTDLVHLLHKSYTKHKKKWTSTNLVHQLFFFMCYTFRMASRNLDLFLQLKDYLFRGFPCDNRYVFGLRSSRGNLYSYFRIIPSLRVC